MRDRPGPVNVSSVPRRPWLWGVIAALLAVTGSVISSSSACSPSPFTCVTAVDCVSSGGVQGACESGYCAYSDPTCTPTQERYSISAGNGLANMCVGADASAASDASLGSDGGMSVDACSACPVNQVCTSTTTEGPSCTTAGDAGLCPEGGAAAAASYKCWPTPVGCTTGAACNCAYQLCGLCGCKGLSDSGTALQCECAGP